MTNFHQYLKSPPNETWQQALMRFKQLCHVEIVQSWDDGKGNKGEERVNLSEFYDDGTLYEVTNKEPIENIQTYEAIYAMVVPPSLVNLMCEHGAFNIYMVSLRFAERYGGRKFLAIYDEEDTTLFPSVKPLCKAISFNMGDYFADDELTKEQVAYLNNNYFCFGYIGLDDGEVEYLYFDRNHHFGSYRFISEDYPANLAGLAPLLSNTAAPQTLDELLTYAIDNAITLVLEYSEIYLDQE